MKQCFPLGRFNLPLLHHRHTPSTANPRSIFWCRVVHNNSMVTYLWNGPLHSTASLFEMHHFRYLLQAATFLRHHPHLLRTRRPLAVTRTAQATRDRRFLRLPRRHT